MSTDLIAKATLLTLLLLPASIASAQFGNGLPGGGTADVGNAPARTVNDLFDKLPAELRPTKEGWNGATLSKVEDWIRQNVVGRRVEATVTLTTIEIESTKRIEADQAWRVTAKAKANLKPGVVGVARIESPVLGKDAKDITVDFITDEDTARKWQKKVEKIRNEYIRTQRPPSSADGTASGAVRAFVISRETLTEPGGKSATGYRIRLELDALDLAFKDLPTKTPPPPAKKP
jgi:hypothetical protein